VLKQKMKDKEMASASAKFEKLYEEHFSTVYKFIFRKIPNRQMAEDITQDVFYAAWKKGDDFLNHEEPKLWLMVTARNKIHELYRRMKRWTYEALEEDHPRMAVSDREYEGRELELTALDIVSEEEWNLIKDYYLEGITIKELAEKYGITENNMRVRLFRLKTKLRSEITR
jgi:RNA polymerase sigma-70 factor (ECF subfamily)